MWKEQVGSSEVYLDFNRMFCYFPLSWSDPREDFIDSLLTITNTWKKRSNANNYFLLFVDIDECKEETFNCTELLKCKNLIGAYECGCEDGLVETTDGTCRGNTSYSCRILPLKKVLIDIRVKSIEPELEENKYVNMCPNNKFTEKTDFYVIWALYNCLPSFLNKYLLL